MSSRRFLNFTPLLLIWFCSLAAAQEWNGFFAKTTLYENILNVTEVETAISGGLTKDFVTQYPKPEFGLYILIEEPMIQGKPDSKVAFIMLGLSKRSPSGELYTPKFTYTTLVDVTGLSAQDQRSKILAQLKQDAATFAKTALADSSKIHWSTK
ncbi:MAG: hypothetical protein NWS57_02865 [Burkholderiaceae bacterium]|jgi:hypothetical protein|nr:hypothetical protein [Burkholderiaceae bacterium]